MQEKLGKLRLWQNDGFLKTKRVLCYFSDMNMALINVGKTDVNRTGIADIFILNSMCHTPAAHYVLLLSDGTVNPRISPLEKAPTQACDCAYLRIC